MHTKAITHRTPEKACGPISVSVALTTMALNPQTMLSARMVAAPKRSRGRVALFTPAGCAACETGATGCPDGAARRIIRPLAGRLGKPPDAAS